MDIFPWNIVVALGIGLLIGVERERSDAEQHTVAFAGIRTFALTALLGALAFSLGSTALLVAVALAVAALVALSYHHSSATDLGGTTEIAMLVTLLCGAMAVEKPALAAGTGTVVAVLLHIKPVLHQTVRTTMTRNELTDGLLLAAAALVVWPLLPDRQMGPYDAWNPHLLWLVVLLFMAMSAAGHLAVRLLGQRYGLPVAGLFGGFVTSTGTIASLAGHGAQPHWRHAAIAGALLSTVATYLQMMFLLGIASPQLLKVAAAPLGGGLLVIALFGGFHTWRSVRHAAADHPDDPPGRMFDWRIGLTFALIVSVLQVITLAVNQMFGQQGVTAAALLGGFADAHATAVSIGSMTAAGKMAATDGLIPVLAALTSNAASKIVVAMAGGRRFAWPVAIGIVLSTAASWAMLWLAVP